MPISEDEYDHHGGQNHAMSKAEQRRSNKPIMEKRRRARINHCLNELKSLILDAMKKDPARHSKLEKADILEMTVKHLQSVQRQQLAVAVATDPAVLHKFKTGFNECAGEVSRYIGRLDGVEPVVKQRLVSHLAHCVSGLQQLTPLAFTATVQPPAPQPPPPPAAPAAPTGGAAPGAGDVNNNRGGMGGGVPTSGLQLIPSRLPTGEFALLLPGGGNVQGLPFFPTPPAPVGSAAATAATLIDRSHPSAFTAVDRPRRTPPPPSSHSNYPLHPPLSPASSVSSGDDCSLTSEAYLSSSSPPLHIPHHAPSNISNDTYKPLSVSDSQPPLPKSVASVGVGTVTEVKVEFKTIPVHGSVFPAMTSSPSAVSSMALTTASTAHQPLTVITSQPSTFKTSVVAAQTESTVAYSCPVTKDALDFSLKKEEPHLQSASTQTTTNMGMKRSLPASFNIVDPSDSASPLMYASPNKVPRYSLHMKADSDGTLHHISPPETIVPSPTGSLLKVVTPKHIYTPVGEDLTNKSMQSSSGSGSEVNTSTSSTSSESSTQSGSNKDMWRPW